MTQCSSTLKEQEVKNFKTDVRISQVENRIEANERRLSTDSRRLGTLEDNPIDRYSGEQETLNIKKVKHVA